MGQPTASRASDWLSLGEASRMLGITPGTLRRWADHGEIATFVTPGGHRRFPRGVIEALVPQAGGARMASAPLGASASRVASAYRRARPVARRSASPALHALAEADRLELRDRGHRLLALLLEYLDGGRTSGKLAEAVKAAAGYGQRAAELGVSLSDTVEAFVRFRRAFVDELAAIARRRRLDTREATALLVEAERAVDRLLVALMNGHGGARS